MTEKTEKTNVAFDIISKLIEMRKSEFYKNHNRILDINRELKRLLIAIKQSDCNMDNFNALLKFLNLNENTLHLCDVYKIAERFDLIDKSVIIDYIKLTKEKQKITIAHHWSNDMLSMFDKLDRLDKDYVTFLFIQQDALWSFMKKRDYMFNSVKNKLIELEDLSTFMTKVTIEQYSKFRKDIKDIKDIKE